MKSTSTLYVVGVICTQVIIVWCHYAAKEPTDVDRKKANGSTASHISDHRFFLHEIFTKYGHGGQMTFEGFEHLLESLGLGNIIITDHDAAAHKGIEFRHSTHEHSKKGDFMDVTAGREVTAQGHESHGHRHPSESTITTSPRTSSASNRHRHGPQNALPSTHADYESDHSHHLPDNSGHTHYHQIETRVHTNNGTRANETHLPDENIYHYRMREENIPEYLVNISTLVDQHHEMEEGAPEMVIEQCLSPKEILDAFGINQTSSLNPVSFLHLCPAIIYELDQGHCLIRDHSHRKSGSMPSTDQWLFSILAVVLISLCGLLSVAIIPIMKKWFYHTLLQFLIGLAIGSLSGDGLLHLMPHAMLGGEGSHDHDGSSSSVEAEKMAVWRGFAALGGIFFFFIAERLLGSYAAYRKQKKELKISKTKQTEFAHVNGISSAGNVGEKLSQYRKNSFDFEPNEKEMINMLKAENFSSRKPSIESLSALEASFQKRPSFSIEPSGIAPHCPVAEFVIAVPEYHAHSHSHAHGHSHEVPDSVSAVAWMVIMGDGLHNFCDGLAIGAAFASGLEGGISTTVAVFCHELPHELGDFAMLLKTGMKVKQAMMYNGLSSVLCFIGMIIGVYLGNVESATSWVFAGTAGMFLYIALVDMLPELSVPSDDPESSSTHQLAVQVLGICCGVSIMLLIANYEQELQNIVS